MTQYATPVSITYCDILPRYVININRYVNFLTKQIFRWYGNCLQGISTEEIFIDEISLIGRVLVFPGGNCFTDQGIRELWEDSGNFWWVKEFSWFEFTVSGFYADYILTATSPANFQIQERQK